MISRILALLSTFGPSGYYYAPDAPPQTYKDGERIDLWVNSLTSPWALLPRDYYRLPFCSPEGEPVVAKESLGERMTGNKIRSSPYLINVGEDVDCQVLCEKTLDRTDAARLRFHIYNVYHNNWILDNLPSASIGKYKDMFGDDLEYYTNYGGGFPIGFMNLDNDMPYVFNHVSMYIQYQEVPDGKRIVGFAVEPTSINHRQWVEQTPLGGINESQPLLSCASAKSLVQDDMFLQQIVEKQQRVLFTYDVTWQRSDIEWSTRWGEYLSESKPFSDSIGKLIYVVLILSGYIACAVVRNLRHDIDLVRAQPPANSEAVIKMDETGWTTIRADVFRPPSTYPALYCVFLGTGAQLCLLALLLLTLSAVGILSPARRGSLLNAFVVLFVLTGPIAGYVSSRMYKTFDGTQWQNCALLTATFFPGMAFGLFLFLSAIHWILHAVAASFSDVLTVAGMWCVSALLVFSGAYHGYKHEAIKFPTATSDVARPVPPPSRLLSHRMVGMTLAGIVPYAAAYNELFFILKNSWTNQFYDMFEFTQLLVYVLLILSCVELTVTLVYHQLRAENHRWWWYAFYTSGSVAFFIFIYSIFWFGNVGWPRPVATYLLYFGYMFLASFAAFLVFGCVGALASLWFVRKIFYALDNKYE